MSRGFKDSKKKFHPITNRKGVRKSRMETRKPLNYKDPELIRHAGIPITEKMMRTGRRFKKDEKFETRTYKVWKLQDAPPEIRERIFEWFRQNISGQDTSYADDDGILYDTKEDFAGYQALSGNIPTSWDVSHSGRDFIQFENLEVKDEKKLAKYLGIPEKLRQKISMGFLNEGSNNTSIRFFDVMGNEINLTDDVHSYDDSNNFYMVDKEDKPTFNEFKLLLQAHDKWADLMDMSLKHLRNSFDSEFTEEYIEDIAEANDYKFKEDGSLD